MIHLWWETERENCGCITLGSERVNVFVILWTEASNVLLSLGSKQDSRPRIQFLAASDDEEEEEEEDKEDLKPAAVQFMPSRIRPRIQFTMDKEEKKKPKVCKSENQNTSDGQE